MCRLYPNTRRGKRFLETSFAGAAWGPDGDDPCMYLDKAQAAGLLMAAKREEVSLAPLSVRNERKSK